MIWGALGHPGKFYPPIMNVLGPNWLISMIFFYFKIFTGAKFTESMYKSSRKTNISLGTVAADFKQGRQQIFHHQTTDRGHNKCDAWHKSADQVSTLEYLSKFQSLFTLCPTMNIWQCCSRYIKLNIVIEIFLETIQGLECDDNEPPWVWPIPKLVP